MNELNRIADLQGVETAMRKELERIAEGYIVVGYLLKKTRDEELFREKGYKDVFDFAKQTFNISRTWANRFMQINDTYSIDGNSPEIQEKYKGYGSSKLSEMLTLPEESREEVPQSATVKEIREAKEVIRQTEDRYSPQLSLCDVAPVNTEAGADFEGEEKWINTLIYEFFKGEGKPCFEKMDRWLRSDEAADSGKIERDVMSIVAPTKFRMLRMQKANALFGESTIKIMPYNGQGEKETHSYMDFAKAFERMFYPEGMDKTDAEAYESVYEEALREKKEREVIKAEKLKKTEPQKAEKKKEPDTADRRSEEKREEQTKEEAEEPERKMPEPAEEKEEQIPGQMEVTDFPELMPELDMNHPEEPVMHEITEEVIQEGERITDILKSGDPDKVMKLIRKEFPEPEQGWEAWAEKVVNLGEH